MVDGAVVWARDPKWEDSLTPIWLRLEWVGVEGGRIVLHIEIMQPIEITQHEPRPESRCAPFTRIAVDPYGASFESTIRGKEMTIMLKIMYSDFEPPGRKFLS